ncbi:MAG: xanthine dehydrogenase family protein molybdopterin-binding subunit [Chloroflexota bacterium]|nr:xanthine dehydrogenase family protein molybdopterin-binding subunit [Chloroflexota bacterium]
MTTTTDKNNETSNYRVIGTRPMRHDAVDKVTGAAKYGVDFNVPGMLHGKILRSPHAHAKIVSIDTSKAEAVQGVLAVATASDFPIIASRPLDYENFQGNPRLIAENIFAHEKVLYKGHAVAAVAATSQHIAEAAVELIEVKYEVLPTVLTWRDALKENATLLHDQMTTRFRVERFGPGDDTGEISNIAGHLQHKLGDVEKGFQEADVIFENEYETQTIHQGYIEPHVASAVWGSDGRVTVWTSTQGPFGVRTATAAILELPESAVKVVPMEIGGGFGAKGVTYLAPVAAVLARKSGKPVKVVMTRKEVFEGSGPASATFMRVKLGAKKDGKLTAGQVYMVYEAGAFPGAPVGGGAVTTFGSYNCENILVDGYDVVCNKQKAQSYRAPGQPQAGFAVECAMDELAEELHLDPMDLRLKNAVSEGDRMPNGVAHARFGCVEVEEAMKNHPHYTAPLGGPNQGRGVAVAFRAQGGQVSSATINVNSNGTLNLITGSVDIGGTRTATAMQVAETLGIDSEDINPAVGDTDSVGYTGGTGGSRTAFDTGLAGIAAAEEVIRLMKGRAALLWEVQDEDVQFSDGVFICSKNSEDRYTFKELASRLMRTGGPVTCSAATPSTGVGPIFSGNIVDVEVDPDTGKVDILRCTAFIDAGQAVHPSFVEGQIQGATVQGIGWALNEEYVYNSDGSMANSSFLDYRMPTSLDLPMIESVIIEVPNPRHPFGLRGVGEGPIIPPLPAVANAVSHATGVRMRKLPMSPANIREAIDGN